MAKYVNPDGTMEEVKSHVWSGADIKLATAYGKLYLIKKILPNEQYLCARIRRKGDALLFTKDISKLTVKKMPLKINQVLFIDHEKVLTALDCSFIK